MSSSSDALQEVLQQMKEMSNKFNTLRRDVDTLKGQSPPPAWSSSRGLILAQASPWRVRIQANTAIRVESTLLAVSGPGSSETGLWVTGFSWPPLSAL